MRPSTAVTIATAHVARTIGRVPASVYAPAGTAESNQLPRRPPASATLTFSPPWLTRYAPTGPQQSAARLKAGQGAPEPGQDYVFTGPEGGLLNVNNLRDHARYGGLKSAGLRRRTMYQTRHSFASNALAAGEAPSWVAAQLGHTTPEMLFSVCARFIPNRTRRDGSALLSRMVGGGTGEIRARAEAVRN